jgi:hypothetical protein
VRDILHPVDGFDLVELLDFRGEPAVQAEHFAFDDGREREVGEDLGEELPNGLGAVLLEALIVEPVLPVDLSVLVVAAQDGDAVAVLDLEDQHIEEGLDAVEAAVDIIAHEKVVGVLS